MTESKPPPPGRIVRQTVGSIVATPTATGHSYLPASQYPQFIPGRAKPSVPPSTRTTTAVPHSIIANPVTTPFHVPLQLGLTKTPLTVVTAKPNAGIHAVPRPYPGVTVNSAPVESHVKANVKPVGVQKVSHMKQITGPTKSVVTTSLSERITQVPPNLVQTQIKKAIDVKPVLIGPGLRQPSKPHQHFQHQITKTSYNPSSWVVHQQDQSKASTVAAVPRTKPPVMVRSVYQVDSPQSSQATVASIQDLSKKHNVTHQPKTTISIMPVLSDVSQRNLAISVSPSLTSVNKSVYQIMTPGGFQSPIPGHVNPVKKLQTMIVTQVANSSAANAGFVPSCSAASSGQITVVTGEAGITYVPAPAATNSTPIPVAKVYPQQQPISRISVTATSGRLSVPVITSASGTRGSGVSTPRSTPTVLQVGTVKSSTATSTIIATASTTVSTIPVTLDKTSTANPVLCWPTTFSISPYQPHAMPLLTTSSESNPATAITLTSSTLPQQTIPATIAGRTPSHVFLVDNSRTTLQAPTGSATPVLQTSDVGRGSVGNPVVMGPATPTVSPKPAILRRQRPDSSNALKKLSFQPSSNFSSRISQKPTDRRSAPYHFNRSKVTNRSGDSKTNEIAVMIQPNPQPNDKTEIKPVLANQVHGKQVTSNGFAPIKVNSIKSAGTGQFPDSKEVQPFSVHSIIDMKVKMEPGTQCYTTQLNSVKPESASASQMLQYQSQSMHTYAAESPQSLPHRILTQASGQHVKTNTIFASPGSYSSQRRYPMQANSRGKATHVIKPGAHLSGTGPGPPSTQHGPPYAPQAGPGGPQSNSVSSFLHSRARPDPKIQERIPPGFDHIKKEPPHAGSTAGTQQIKLQPPDNTHSHVPHHITTSPGRSWSHLNNTDPMTGLSPRKRPRKQTHVVSEVPPDVEMMEDEESTDDADECEDEPMTDTTSHSRDTNATPSSKMPGHKLLQTPRTSRTEPLSKKPKDEARHKSSVKSEPTISPISESKPLIEYTDDNGVRYVATRKRPAISVLNKLKPNGRSIANHFMRYSDIKVKEKKVTISDLASDRKRLKGLKVASFASQLKDMVEFEKDVWQRMQTVYNGLVQFRTLVLGDPLFEDNNSSPAPSTPMCLSNSFHKAKSTPRSSRSGSMSSILEIGPLSSPLTPMDRRAHKVQEEIVKIEELAQANLQRCQVVSDQMFETKTMLLKSLDHRQLAGDILEGSTNQKQQPTTVNTSVTKRMPKKKNNS